MSAINRLSLLLGKPVTEAKKKSEVGEPVAPPPVDGFEDFIKVLKTEFKEGLLGTQSNGAILKASLTKEAFVAASSKFDSKGKEDWIFGNGMSLLSAMPETEPESYKLYFCRFQTLNAAE